MHLFIFTDFFFFKKKLDNTNNLKFELYVIHADIDGMGFSLAHLFLKNNENCENGI